MNLQEYKQAMDEFEADMRHEDKVTALALGAAAIVLVAVALLAWFL